MNIRKARFLFLALFIGSILFGACEKIVFRPDPQSDPLAVYDYFIDDFKKHYALFELKGIDSDTFGLALRSSVSSKTTDRELFKIIAQQSRTVKDGHVMILSSFASDFYYNVSKTVPANEAVNITNYASSVLYGSAPIQYRNMIDPNLGYISISSFDGAKSDFEAIGAALDKLSDKKGLIIDVRSNGGGQSDYADIVASHFTTKKIVYGKASAKIGPNKTDFSPWVDATITPSLTSQYLKPVVILTNRKSFSSTEIFLMIMQNFPKVTIVGDTTGGGVGAPAWRELPNGWVYRLSTHRLIRPDGSTVEGKGIIPDYVVWNTPVEIGKDKILEKAIELLK